MAGQQTQLRGTSITAKQFLDFCHWEMPAAANDIQTALNYFLTRVPQDVLYAIDKNHSPWALPKGGPYYRLTSWMQAIDFSSPVTIRNVQSNERFKTFLRRRSGRPGNWYTFLSTKQRALAIPHNQDRVKVFRAICPFQCLETTVSDAYVDWACNDPDDPAEAAYRLGGGRQFFIWDAAQCLSAV